MSLLIDDSVELSSNESKTLNLGTAKRARVLEIETLLQPETQCDIVIAPPNNEENTSAVFYPRLQGDYTISATNTKLISHIGW